MPINRREFIKIGAAGAIGFGVASAIEIPLLESNYNPKISQLEGQNTNLQNQINSSQGFLTLNIDEQPLVEAIAETMIPADSNGPGANEAGVVYFIDRQLASDYGNNARMYMQGPFIQPNQTAAITVGGVTYSGGSAPARYEAGTGYQYPLTLREFWRNGLLFTQAYCQTTYNNKFENLTSAQQTQVLTDLWNNKPTNFTGPTPQEFFSEVYDMVVAGFFADPLYGGNIGLVGWLLQGSNGVNMGTAQGYSPPQLMLLDYPVRLPPASLTSIQKPGAM